MYFYKNIKAHSCILTAITEFFEKICLKTIFYIKIYVLTKPISIFLIYIVTIWTSNFEYLVVLYFIYLVTLTLR